MFVKIRLELRKYCRSHLSDVCTREIHTLMLQAELKKKKHLYFNYTEAMFGGKFTSLW